MGKIILNSLIENHWHKSLILLAVTLLLSIPVAAQSILTTKVYGKSGEDKYYGKLYIPKGNKWRIARTPKSGVMVTVYSSYLDGSDIYLYPLSLLTGYYWIDATETDQVLIVRSKGSNEDVVLEKVTDAQDADFLADGYYYFNASDKKRNRLNYATSIVTNKTLRESSTYNKRNIYVMANPAKNGLAFAWLDAAGTTRNLTEGSLYVLAKKSAGARLNVIFQEDEENNSTAIQSTEMTSIDDGQIYSMQGVPVTTPKKGGLYIRNGKKFIAR